MSELAGIDPSFLKATGIYLPDDIRECCEVLRDWHMKTCDWDNWPGDHLDEWASQAATWQILEYLGVL